MSGYAAEAGQDAFAEFRAASARMEEWAAGTGAARLDHAELEKEIADQGRKAQQLLLQAHMDVREAREGRLAGVTAADGSPRPQAERGRSRQLATTVGTVTVRRIGYRAPGARIVYPADEQLTLPARKYSLGLRELAALEAARGSFDDDGEAVFRATGVRIGKRQIEELARAAAADFGSFYAYRARAAAPAAGDVLVLQADGKGIRMRPGSLRPAAARRAARAAPKQQGRLSRGEVGTRRRIAENGAVYTITPAPRTARDILGPPVPGSPHEPGGVPDAPRATDKWLTASVAGTAAQVIAAVFAEAGRRDPGRALTWIALVDGNKDQIARIQAEAAARGIKVAITIDIIHVSEYLWDAAWCFFPEASPDAGPWVREQLHAVLDGGARQVAAAIRDRAAGTGSLSRNKHKTAEKTARYLDTKAPFLDYPAALKAGWPISTGVIEGACRHQVKDRMDITGARWSTDGAEAILKLRAIRANGDWDPYWTWHKLQEHRRTYRNHRNSWQLAA